jgi:O-antigen/teichoic acid export membrane protein
MQQKFLSNLVLLVLLNLVIKPVAIFGIDAAVQNRVGSEEYGLFFSLLNFTYLFNILLDLGINNFTTKNVAQYPGLMAKYVGKIAGLRLLLFGVYSIFTIGIALFLGYSSNVYPILGILIVQQFLIAMIAYSRSYLSGMMLFKLDALLSVLDRFLLIVFCGTVLIMTRGGNVFHIEHFIGIQFICYFISFLVGLILMIRYTGKVRVSFHKPISLLIVRESVPYALLIVLMMLFTRVDSVMLERMLENGAKQAGIYAQGFRLIDAFFMFAMLFSNLLLPIFSKMIRLGEDVKELFSISSKLLVWGAIALAAFCFWNAKEVLELIYIHDTTQSAPPFQLLVLTFVAMCIVLIFGTYLTALGEMRTLNTIAFVGLVISIAANLYLIPRYGVLGAAVSTLATQFVVAFAQILIVLDRLKLKWNINTMGLFLIYTSVVFTGMWMMKEYNLSMLFQLIFVVICLLLFRVINVKLFLSILSRKNVE